MSFSCAYGIGARENWCLHQGAAWPERPPWDPICFPFFLQKIPFRFVNSLSFSSSISLFDGHEDICQNSPCWISSLWLIWIWRILRWATAAEHLVEWRYLLSKFVLKLWEAFSTWSSPLLWLSRPITAFLLITFDILSFIHESASGQPIQPLKSFWNPDFLHENGFFFDIRVSSRVRFCRSSLADCSMSSMTRWISARALAMPWTVRSSSLEIFSALQLLIFPPAPLSSSHGWSLIDGSESLNPAGTKKAACWTWSSYRSRRKTGSKRPRFMSLGFALQESHRPEDT